MSMAFASQADLEEKKMSFDQLSEHAWACTAKGDPMNARLLLLANHLGDLRVLREAIDAARRGVDPAAASAAPAAA